MRTLRIACRAVPTGVDREQPSAIVQVENVDAHLQLYEPLLTWRGSSPSDAGLKSGRELCGLAAERWEQATDGKTYRVVLRKGVYSAFDNELTAEDVEWTWNRSLALGTVGAWIGGNAGLSSPDQVRSVGRYEVEFQLEQPTTILPQLLTVIAPTVFDSTEAKRKASASDPWALGWLLHNSAGYGPYVTDGESIGGDGYRLVRNPRYWKNDLVYDEIEYIAVPEPAERLKALRSGDVDIAIDLLNPEPFSDTIVYSVPSTFDVKLGMNCARPPFDKREVRRAVAQAIPYSKILADVYGGKAVAMRSTIADTVEGYFPARTWQYRPGIARKLLENHPPNQMVELCHYNQAPGIDMIAEIIREALCGVGLETKVVILSHEEYIDRTRGRTADMFLAHGAPLCNDARYALGNHLNSPLGGVLDRTGYANAEIDRLLRASLAEMDDGRRRSLLAEVQRLGMEEVPYVPLAQEAFVFAARESVGGYRWYPYSRIRCRDLVAMD
jgi:peptide/nickel transport system substrate-binding protein